MKILKTLGAYILTAAMFALLASALVGIAYGGACFLRWEFVDIDWYFAGRVVALVWLVTYARFLYDTGEDGERNYKSMGQW